MGLDRPGAPLSVKGLPKLSKAADALAVVGALVKKATNGELTPEEAAKLAGLVQSFIKAAETAELAERIRKLEEATARDGVAKKEHHDVAPVVAAG